MFEIVASSGEQGPVEFIAANPMESVAFKHLEENEYYWLCNWPQQTADGVYQFQLPDFPQEKPGLQSVASHRRYGQRDIENLFRKGLIILRVQQPEIGQ